MHLIEQLTADMHALMKSGDKFSLSVVRFILAAVKNVAIALRTPLTDEQVLDVLVREVKQRREAIEEFAKSGRTDLVAQYEAEIAIMQRYMPQPLEHAALEQYIRRAIEDVQATSKKDMGKVMVALLPHIKGRADNKVVNQLVMQWLT